MIKQSLIACVKEIVGKGLIRAACIVSLAEGYCWIADINTKVVGWTKKHQISVLLGFLGILILIHFVWDNELKSLKMAYESSVNFEALNRLVGMPPAEKKAENSTEDKMEEGGSTATNRGN